MPGRRQKKDVAGDISAFVSIYRIKGVSIPQQNVAHVSAFGNEHPHNIDIINTVSVSSPCACKA
jgi:hypothetical protein